MDDEKKSELFRLTGSLLSNFLKNIPALPNVELALVIEFFNFALSGTYLYTQYKLGSINQNKIDNKLKKLSENSITYFYTLMKNECIRDETIKKQVADINQKILDENPNDTLGIMVADLLKQIKD